MGLLKRDQYTTVTLPLEILMRCRNVRERVIRNKVRKEIFRSDLLSEIKSLQLTTFLESATCFCLYESTMHML